MPAVDCDSICLREIHAEILSLMERMVAESENALVQKFRAGFNGLDRNWRDLGANNFPVTAFLGNITPDIHSDIGKLLELFITYRDSLFWEQTYSREDGVVGDALLSGYAFSEITGKRGPFVSDCLRSGAGIWAPDVEYPLHWHEAEEIYWILSGSAWFQVGREASRMSKNAGDIIFVPSSTPHSFVTGDEPLVMFYLWQGGDLRQVSEFDGNVE